MKQALTPFQKRQGLFFYHKALRPLLALSPAAASYHAVSGKPRYLLFSKRRHIALQKVPFYNALSHSVLQKADAVGVRSAFIMAAGCRRCVPCAAVSALSVGLCRGLISAQVAVWQRVARIKISYAELKKLFYFVFSLTYVIFADDLNRDLIMKIALIGYGKMGKMIEQIALGRGHQIVSIIDIDNQQDFDSEAFASADVAIEFTNPTAAYGNYLRAFAHNVKVVSGSTGWMKDHGDDVRKMCAEGGQTLFWASNFSIGVAIFSAVNRYLAKIMNGFPQYSVTMEETHHVHKLDAPSGTAITLAEEIIDNIDRKDSWVKGTLTAPDGHIEGSADCADNELRIDSVRRGEVPGIHTIAYDSEADCITITHDAHSRKGFALGAVLAAEYTAQHSGLLTISDMFKF